MLPLGTARCPNRQVFEQGLLNHIPVDGFHLRDVQLDAAYTYEVHGGLLGPIGVGAGKTFLSILIHKIGMQRRGHYRGVIIVPPEVFSQLTIKDLPVARRNFALDGIPFYVVSGTRSNRMRVASQPGPGVFIYSYSSLSTQTGSDELAAISPTLIVLDEAHCVASPKSARTKRLNSLINDIEGALRAGRLGPNVTAKQVEMVALSGTITKKSVADYAHLARRALREQSPAPIRESAIGLFSAALDASVAGTGLTELDMMRMRMLEQWAEHHGWVPSNEGRAGIVLTQQDYFREAYQYRLRTAPGVVSTSDTGVDASLIISWSEPARPRTVEADKLSEMMRVVAEDMVTPDGDPIDYGMHTFRWLWELSAGFYNSLSWPGEEELVAKHMRAGKPISTQEAEALILASMSHHKLLQKYHQKLRVYLDSQHVKGCDTPLLVAQELTRQLDGKEVRFKLPPILIETYRAHKAAQFDDLPARKSNVVRICDYKIKAAVEWARAHDPAHKGPGGIMWFHHPAVGEWVHEQLVAEGIQHTRAFAGQNEQAYSEGLVLASYAHATGKNLQHQNHNLVIELRREAAIMEQMIGRTHRSGQQHDDVRVDIFVSNGFDLALFNAILRDSDYIQSTMGQSQRLCYATYSPVIPPSNPRLAVKLGIIEPHSDIRRWTTAAHDSITPPEALDLTSAFRSLNYAEQT